MRYSTVAVKMLDLHSNKFRPTLPITKIMASEYSDHVINLNKYEDRNLDVRIKQITKENSIKMQMLKREIDRLKHDYETNQDRIQLIRRQRQMEYEENLRKFLESKKVATKDLDIMHIHNTSKNLAAFYNLSNKKEQNVTSTQQQPQQQEQKAQPLIKREPSRLSIRNRLLLNSKARLIHSSYAKKATPAKIETRLANTASTIKHPLMLTKTKSQSKYSDISDMRPNLKARATSLDLNSITSVFDDIESLHSSLIDQDLPTFLNIKDNNTDNNKVMKTNVHNKVKNETIKTNFDETLNTSSLISRKSTSAPANSKHRVESSNIIVKTDDSKARPKTKET